MQEARNNQCCRLHRSVFTFARSSAYSSDRGSKHVREADEAIYIGNITDTPHPHQNIPLLISSAKSVHADAVHPGTL